MAESTLSLTYNTLRQQVGFELGFGSTIGNWDADTAALIDFCVQSGLRQFYAPPPHETGRPAHAWSFLRPLTTLIAFAAVPVNAANTCTGVLDGANTTLSSTLPTFTPTMVGTAITITGVSSTWLIIAYLSPTSVTVVGNVPSPLTPRTFSIPTTGDYPLPDEFGGLESALTIETPEVTEYPVHYTAESIIRQRRLSNAAAGRPTHASVTPVRLATSLAPASSGQRFSLQVFPIPDVNYTLRFAYCVLPDAINANNLFPFGGMQHAETILASCLEVAERRVNKERGTAYAKWREQLLASISADLRSAPQRLGFSSSEDRPSPRQATVKYNGVSL